MSEQEHTLGDIKKRIEAATRILVTTHEAPDGDALGSLLAMGGLLVAQAKDHILACVDPVPSQYKWLPGSDRIVQKFEQTVDLIISLDCSDARRMGRFASLLEAGIPLINIDHHITNSNFGVVNWVDPTSASTTQMFLTLIDELEWVLTQPIAVCLLTGLVTDTRSFRTTNVDAAVIRAALRFMEAGAHLSKIARQALEQRSLASVRLWGDAVANMQLDGCVLFAEVTQAMRARWGVEDNGTSGLANYLSGIREADVVVVLTERGNGTVDVSMRSAPGFDVARVAVRLGGGGHPQAAGCTIEDNLGQVRERVLTEIRQCLDAQQDRDL